MRPSLDPTEEARNRLKRQIEFQFSKVFQLVVPAEATSPEDTLERTTVAVDTENEFVARGIPEGDYEVHVFNERNFKLTKGISYIMHGLHIALHLKVRVFDDGEVKIKILGEANRVLKPSIPWVPKS